MSFLSIQFINEVLRLTNELRAEHGLSSLKANSKLGQTAQTYAQTMATEDFFDHVGKDESTAWTRAEKAGYKAQVIGENIAAGQRSPQSVVEGWMNSPKHRANILSPEFTELGIGYFNLENDTGTTNYNTYWTQVFGSGDLLVSAAPSSAKSSEQYSKPLTSYIEVPIDSREFLPKKKSRRSPAQIANPSSEESNGAISKGRSSTGVRNNAWLKRGLGWIARRRGNAITLDGPSRTESFDHSKDTSRSQPAQRIVSRQFNIDSISEAVKQTFYEKDSNSRNPDAYIDDNRLFVAGWYAPKAKWDGSWINSDRVNTARWYRAATLVGGQETAADNALTTYSTGEKNVQAKGSQLWDRNWVSLGSVTDSTRLVNGGSSFSETGFAGVIDEVKIFNDALTNSQVQGLATS